MSTIVAPRRFSTRAGSHLRAVEAAFAAQETPLLLDCDALSAAGNGLGLPAGVVSLVALRRWLLDNPGRHDAADVVWRELVTRARVDGGGWRLAVIAMAAPGLSRVTRRLRNGFTGDAEDMDSEVLTGFLAAVDHRLDLAKPAVFIRLVRAGQDAGLRLRTRTRTDDAELVEDVDLAVAGSRTPQRPYGHPDLLVRRACQLGVIAAADEEPFLEVRLGYRAIEPVAARLGVTADCLRMRLNRAGDRLAAALASGLLTGSVVPEAARARATAVERRVRADTGMSGVAVSGSDTGRGRTAIGVANRGQGAPDVVTPAGHGMAA
ncbi:hypothetical protein Val02_62840 [Virgisporangium aliadipatigenens]|uniref:Uncharacterized protein n=1 Tax=Virgisporangium aliadipatigenens TaxID=741659 RepID=A0A8J3YS43_9ACTN|nr:hypothetical protein [Virgisporangium aliadipatigenens]GIJ49398.1 hypothetical protein Val02_62840 [Virgisporangium aliadipatigenens]